MRGRAQQEKEKRMKKILFVLAGALLAATAFGQGKLTLAQGKVEIDKALKAYAAVWGKANNVETNIITSGGDNGDLSGILKSAYAAGELPDIFVIAGPDDVKDWSTVLADLSNEKWVSQTSVAYKENGKVIGQPVALEGWGMAYNADVLKAAGVDPLKLNNLAAYKAAFAKIDAQKAKLGLTSVVSMAASSGMGWVVAHHNVNSYLSNGLKYGDKSVAELALAGKVDAKRLAEYSDWVELLFNYADKAVLTNGTYDDQVGAFAAGKAAFLHQGNWVDPNLASAKITFKAAYAPHGSSSAVTDGVFVNPPSWYVVNKSSKNLAAAKKFLNDLVFTEAGQKFQVVDAGMIPAFKNITLKPAGPLSQSIQEWTAKGKIYSWNQYLLPNAFRNDVLAPIYNQWALGQIDKKKFIDLFTKAIATLKP
jgi:raffinose/stachyose/melibiose transport system substrate-binding protein